MMGAMSRTKRFSPRRRASRQACRAQLLAAFERSGLSAAAFARQHGVAYTTFCGWRYRRARTQSSPGFVQVELPVAAAPVELVIELGAHARLRVAASQIALAVQLLQALHTPTPC